MAKALCISLLALLLMNLLGSAAAAHEKRPISQQAFESMIQDQPLILQGEVMNVEVKLITPKELYGGANSAIQIAMTEVTMKIEKVIAGEYDEAEIRIILLGGMTKEVTTGASRESVMKGNVGDRAIVAFKLDALGTGCNVLDREKRFFRIEGTSLVPYREEFYLAVDNPLELMARKAKERKLPEIVKASDLICTGTVTKLIDSNSPSRKLVVSVDELLKGTEKKSEITLNMYEIFLPSKVRDAGFRVLLFLKKDGSEYKPVAGVNGYYTIDGERFIRGHSTPIRMSVSQMKSAIKTWVEAKR